MVRSLISSVATVAFVAAMLLAPFTHLHLGAAAHQHIEGDAAGLVHTHLTAHQHQGHHHDPEPRWGAMGDLYGVPLDTLVSEPGQSTVAAALLGMAHVPASPDHLVGRVCSTQPRAHGPPADFPVAGRAPPV